MAPHVRRHRPDEQGKVRREPKARPAKPPTTGQVVTRKVDGSGSVSFTRWRYRVGNPYKRKSVDVAVVRDGVQISSNGKLVRTHPVCHDPRKEHGAFANPGGRPKRINAA